MKNFHGLDLEQATALLRENPLHYLEDFYYLGPRAFAFYAPAVRTLVREGRLGEPDGGEWERLISVVELRIADGLLPPESVPVLRECLDALAEQMPVEADWPAEFDEYAIYAEVASKLERVRAKLAELP